MMSGANKHGLICFYFAISKQWKEVVYKLRVRRLEAQTHQGRERINSQSLDPTLDIQSKGHVIPGRTIWKVKTKV